MRRFTITLLTAVALAIAPAVSSAQTTGQTIPVPGPILTKIGHTPMVELWDGGGGLPYLGSTGSYNAGDWENALRAYATPPAGGTSVYEQQIAKVDAVATAWIRRASSRGGDKQFRLRRKSNHRGVKVVHVARHGHGHGDRRKAAIVFDIDETSLSNYSAIEKDNFTFGPFSQAEATDEIGVKIPPTLALFQLAQRKHIATFFITGRRENTRAHTTSNLAREGFTGYNALVLKPDASSANTVDYKSGARKAIEDQGFRIVANVGDQYSDLAGGHSTVAFKLPNPFYFLP
jgi:acid phosphatase class B